jgi:2,4-dienoyl-CoA reductase-like NADH-dependent reductase (Old Yellow Enzyme family)
MAEATAVSPEGRISPWDLGIWNDEQCVAFERMVDFISTQSATPAIQLAHAGRKASQDRPWNGGEALGKEKGGWEIVAPSPIAYDDESIVPTELSPQRIEDIVDAFTTASRRSVEAGFRVIELHFAHGYLGSEFLSPLSNVREDDYGGSFDNRCRFPLDVVRSVREVIPETMPLIVRLSVTEYVDGGWDIDSTLKLTHRLRELGVDMIDCSSGGNSPHQNMNPYPEYQVPFASRIRKETNILTGAVGLITRPVQAEEILTRGDADVVLMGRELLRNPYWTMTAQKKLDGETSVWPNQYVRAS